MKSLTKKGLIRFTLKISTKRKVDQAQALLVEECDPATKTVLPSDAPPNLLPAAVVGDRNCGPCLLSMVAYGDKEHHAEMRARIVLEISLHPHKYT